MLAYCVQAVSPGSLTPGTSLCSVGTVDDGSGRRKRNGTASRVGVWNVVFPGLGSSNAPGRFVHMMSFASPVELMASQNHIANEEGWRGLEEYEQKYATCRPPSAYFARVRNRP